MTANPETLRLYASIMERPRMGEVATAYRNTHGMPINPGEISKACAAALRFQADAIGGCNCTSQEECNHRSGCQIAKAGVPHICLCDLSGDLHVVTFQPRTCCEVCQIADTEPFTPESVTKAFKFLAEQISAHNNKVNAAVADLEGQ